MKMLSWHTTKLIKSSTAQESVYTMLWVFLKQKENDDPCQRNEQEEMEQLSVVDAMKENCVTFCVF